MRRSRANQIQFTLILALVATMFAAFPALAGKVSKPPKKSGTIGVLSATTRNVCQAPASCTYSTISSAVAAANAGDTISIAAGTYAETVTVNKWLFLVGAGPTTIIDPPSGRGIEITASGIGASANSRLTIKDLEVTGATDGIWVSAGVDPVAYLTISNVISTANSGNGLHFAGTGSVSDAVVAGSTFSSNSGSGIRIATAVPSFDGLSVSQTGVTANGGAGFDYNPDGTLANVGTNFTFDTVIFNGNNTLNAGNTHEMSFFAFRGNATLRHVDVTGVKATYGIVFSNKNTFAALGTVILDDVTVDGTVAKGGLTFQYYSDTPSVTLTAVDVSAVTAPWGQFILNSTDADAFPLGDTTLKTAVLWASGGIDATSATFVDVASPFGALSRSVVSDGYKVADQTVDTVDAGAGLGLIRWKSATVFITPNSYVSPYTAGSIQRAINAATAGDTVNVKAGTYVESLTVTKALTIAGAGRASTTIGESGNTSLGTILTIRDVVNGSVSVSGFTLRTGTASVVDSNGVFINNISNGVSVTLADNEIYGHNDTTDPAMSNYPVYANNGGATAAFAVTGSILHGGGDNTLLIEKWRGDVTVSGNTLYRVAQDQSTSTVLFMMNYGGADATGTQVIEGNTFQMGGGLTRSDAFTLTSAFNSFNGNGLVGSNGTGGFANVTFRNNLITGLSGASGRGVVVWDQTNLHDSAINVTITGNSFVGTSTQFGVRLTGPDITATIRNNAFPGVKTAILGYASGSLLGPLASKMTVAENDLSTTGVSGALGVNWTTGQETLDASNNWWGSQAGATGKTAGSVTTLPWISTYTADPDKSGAPGFWPTSIGTEDVCTTTCYVSKAGNDSATGSSINPFLTIQKAVTTASAGGTIYVAAGSYTEDVTIGKALTLRGAKYGVAAGPAAVPSGRETTSPYTGESVIDGKLTISNISGVTLDGFVLVRSNELIVMNGSLSTTIKNNIFIANGGSVGSSGQFIISKISSSSNATYTVQNNWFKGGYNGIGINEDTAGSSWLVDGNYATTMNRFIQTFGSMNAAATYSNNRIVDVVKGIRIAESYAGTVIQRNTIVATDKAIECGSLADGVKYFCESLEIYDNKLSGTNYAIYVLYPKGTLSKFNRNRFVAGTKYIGLSTPEATPTIDATSNVWDNDSAQPGAPRKLDLAGVTVTRIPFISSYTEDSGHTNDPGFWTSATGSESGCAATCYVSTTGDDTNTGTLSFPFLTLAQAIASVDAGGTVAIAAGTFAAQDLHVTKAMTIDGVGATTVLDGAGTAALWIDADDVTISDLTIQDGADGIRFDTGTLISDTTLDTIMIKDNSGVGVETRNSTTVDGLQVLDSTFSKNSVGIRWASSGIGIDVVVDGSTFLNQTSGLHIYEANGGSSTGHLDGLTVTDSHFTQTDSVAGNQAGVFVEEARDVTVQGSTFTGLMRGVFLSNIYSGYSGGLAGNYLIDDNDFTDLKYPPVVVETTQLDLPATVSNNVFLQDVTTTAGDRGAVIELRLKSGFDHATVSILDNSVTLSKSEGASVPSSFGVLIRGDYDGVVIRGNTFDGGGVSGAGNGGAVDGSGGTYPQGAGVSVRTNDSSQGAPSASSTLVVQNNWITGFVDGIGFYNAVAKTFGGLPAVNAVSITTNRLAGNSGSGVHNGSDNAVDARANYWGCEAGPNETGCDSTAGSVTSSPYIKIFTLSARTPGWWPSSTVAVAGLTQSDEPQTVPLAGEELGSPSITIASAPAGATVTVEATDPEDLPVASTPFKVDGATLIDIKVSAGVTGPFTICLNGDIKKDRLWHFEDGFWVDMTNRVIAPGSLPSPYPSGQICGMTATLSPFAMAEQVAPGDEDCVYDGNLHSLRVPLAQNESISVARIGTTLYVGSPTYVCVPRTIGDSTWEVYGLVIEGNSGDETVTILDATFANWGGQYSGVDLYRTIDLGTGSGDRVILQGTSGPDSLVVDGFADFSNIEIYRLEGLGDNDYLVGSSVEDELLGGPGADTLRGNAGSDGLIPGAGNDSIQGGSGFDCLSYFDELSSVAVNLNTGSATGASIGTDTFGGIECAQGGQANDSLSGSAGADSLYGGYGDDTLIGRGGNDWLDGGDGSDTASYVDQTYYPVTVNLETGSGSGTGVGTDAFTSIENATGGTAADSLTGSSGPNVLSGGPGADTLVGGGDADTLNGDGESDVLIGNAGDDAINGGSGTDTVSYSEQSDTVTVDLSNSPGSGVSTSAGTDSLTGIENATGGSGQDSLTGSTGPNTLVGGAGADTLNGGDGIDTLRGGDDGDFLNGDAGGDYLYGDAGNDVIRGGTENDTLRGGLGDDILVGGAGDDLFYGDDGTDTVSYDDATYGEAATSGIWFNLGLLGTQQSTGGAGGDTVMGSIENLTGSSYNDKLVGDSGNNDILGLGGDDTIYGTDGDDRLDGGEGTDTISGGNGTDVCVGEVTTTCP